MPWLTGKEITLKVTDGIQFYRKVKNLEGGLLFYYSCIYNRTTFNRGLQENLEVIKNGKKTGEKIPDFG